MPTIPITDKNLRELSPERDFPIPAPVKMRYAILSSPRSGSTLLGRFLHETKMAGDPQEYFNPPLIALERKRTGQADMNLATFMKRMEQRRTSPNGVFGIKMHYSQLLPVFRAKQPNEQVVNYLRRTNKLVWIRRRDRLGQAISQAVAVKTNVWSSEDSRFKRDPDVKIHPYEIVETLRLICREDAGWEQLVAAAKLEVHEVWYEDLTSEYERAARAVLQYLGIDQDVPSIPPPPIERQAGELNDRLRKEVHSYLGLPPVS
jgi:LPS sulfotransferase NodH